MKQLLAQAAKFMEENPSLNEVELTDSFGNKVRVARYSPAITYYTTPAFMTTPYQY